MSESILSNFKIREPILRDELKTLMNVKNEHSFSQYVSVLLKLGLIKLFQNGIYYIPDSDERFKKLEPSLIDVIEKKYCSNYKGFRTGSALLNKYGFTSQISSRYEILSSNVSKNSRNVKVFNGRAFVTSSKIKLNKKKYNYVVFAELIKNIKYSDYNKNDNIVLLKELFKELNIDKYKFLEILKNYKGNRLLYMHILFDEVINYEITWK